ncbi:MAG: tetratricopeptide repeat protein [Cyanobacteriota bacterium]|nr:tetratricopeptide repeat protein [Cyanobacteriota bacterium]
MGSSGDAPRIERGLAQYEPDYYAILGVPVNVESKDLRKRSKQVAMALHPDRFVSQPQLKSQAEWLFSKLFSKANELMKSDTERAEYDTLLQLRIRRLTSGGTGDLWPSTPVVKLLRNARNWEAEYVKQVGKIAETQYQSLDQVLERTAELSELNLTYLLLKAGYAGSVPSATTSGFSAARIPVTPVPVAPSPIDTPTSPPKSNASEVRYVQALDMIERQQYKEAIQYLGIAIQSEPKNARYYVRRGVAYQRMGNRGMARADYLQALRLDPDNMEAKQGVKETTDVTTGNHAAGGKATSQPQKISPKDKPNDGGGFLGKIFGGKKS